MKNNEFWRKWTVFLQYNIKGLDITELNRRSFQTEAEYVVFKLIENLVHINNS